MKTLWTIISVMAVVHVFGLLGGVGWLIATDRLNGERVEAIRGMLEVSVDEAKKLEDQSKTAEGEKDVSADASSGEAPAATKVNVPKSASELIDAERMQHDVMMRQLERTQLEVQQLQQNLKLAQDRVRKEREAFLAEKQALEKKLAEIKQRKDDEGFQKVVELYETLPPESVKQVFVNMLKEQKPEQVVSYLEAMDTRRAASVLREFETPAEVEYVVDLTERLRRRGSMLVSDLENAL